MKIMKIRGKIPTFYPMIAAHSCMIHGVKPKEFVFHFDIVGPIKGATMQATLHKLDELKTNFQVVSFFKS